MYIYSNIKNNSRSRETTQLERRGQEEERKEFIHT